MSMSACCYRERSNQTNTNHVYCVAGRIYVSSVTLCVFSSLAFATSVRLLYCCYDDDAIYICIVSEFFFSFQSSLPSSSNNAHTHNTLFPFISTSSFSFSLFFLACYLKEETQFKIASHSSL